MLALTFLTLVGSKFELLPSTAASF